MKKLLSILGTITLIGTNTTSLISCQKPNNNENRRGNKPESKPEPQQPPTNSNWKLDNNPNFINYKVDNKWYIAIFKKNTEDWYIINFLNNSENDKILGKFLFNGVSQNLYLSDLRNYFKNGDVKTVYYWNNTNNPQIPSINSNTGEIIDWNID